MTADSVWERALRGEGFDAGSLLVTDGIARELVHAGGFVHPLFTDPEHARSLGFESAPIPGQSLLLLMGGLVERTGAFNEGVLALVGYREVSFRRRVSAGDRLHLRVDLVGTEPWPEPGRGVVVARFVASVDDEVACEALVLHLVQIDPDVRPT